MHMCHASHLRTLRPVAFVLDTPKPPTAPTRHRAGLERTDKLHHLAEQRAYLSKHTGCGSRYISFQSSTSLSSVVLVTSFTAYLPCSAQALGAK
ncbi:hypothetical protein P280DRAFT_472947 [Massarina eburnea CBS 473.64]|uniref:Uncharacterized protein n=1 Tax=Massarina eburnea CBS 473.64 TaxID=1395130 RepID=A0A6A6RML0_9PLEO|nr:hypothetical protein P280DRAFT_473850 [Massarina eburnea CBS 473.64]KAF2636741.1 hypothetical protein P280DRAFT_472947 [Massarina eburnea CBS 473.64]